ncbi:MAG: HAMP domain-containing protein, partial [Opitutales bacterium]
MTISIVPMFVAVYFNYRFAADGILDNKKENLQALVLRQANEINQFFTATQLMANNLADSQPAREIIIPFANATASDISQIPHSPAFLAYQSKWGERINYYGNNQDFSQVYVANLNGIVLYGAGHRGLSLFDLHAPPASSLAISPLYDQVVKTRQVCTSGMTIQTPDHLPGFYFGAPVFQQNSKTVLIGVAMAELDDNRLQTVLNNRIGLGDTGETMVFACDEGKFTIVNRPYFRPTAMFTSVTPLSGTTAFGDGITPPGQALVAEGLGYRGHDVVAAWTYLPSLNWVLLQKVDQEEVFAPVYALRNFSLGLGLVTLLLVVAIAALVARNITRPVVLLTSIAERIAHGDLTIPVTSGERNEI